MILKILTNDGLTKVSITRKPIAVGGEGFVHFLTHPKYGNCVLKLYKTQDKAEKNKEKILYMMRQTPPCVNDRVRFCWPFGAAFDENEQYFRGYVMLKAFEGSRDLTILDTYSPSQSIAEQFPDDTDWHEKFELNTNRGLQNRLRILYNWVSAIHALHALGKYVMVDIKPENILATHDGKISVIDMDSCQVVDRSKLLFECSAKTPNYFPPEAYAAVKAHQALDYRCDSFAMGCCIYSILIGCHPYTNVRLLNPFNNDQYNTISSRIRANLYYRGNNAQYLSRIPNLDLHKNLDRLTDEIISLFDRTFTDCHDRPAMTEWMSALKKAIKLNN